MDQFFVNVIPVIRLRSTAEDSNRGNLMIIYGGIKEENFRFTVTMLGGKLASLGFNVFCFDFRSNLDSSKFEKFGLCDRLDDAREVALWVRDNQGGPFSLLGLSMGGPLAVRVASELGEKVKNLFLVAPAAYHREAMKPEVKFGPRFKEIISVPESWRETDSFEEIKGICTNILVIKFRDDDVTPQQPKIYFDNIGSKATLTRQVRLVILEGGHNGTYTHPQRQEEIIGAIRDFLALPSMARD